MTNEEAIAIIENEKKCVNRANKNDYCNRDCYNCELVKTDTEILTALDMAIKALEQQPCDDAISRQAMFEILTKYNLEMSKIAEDMNKLPPATPQQKIGHWIIIDDCEQFIAKCSECGRIEDSRMISKYPYCHCGAKMQEGEE